MRWLIAGVLVCGSVLAQDDRESELREGARVLSSCYRMCLVELKQDRQTLFRFVAEALPNVTDDSDLWVAQVAYCTLYQDAVRAASACRNHCATSVRQEYDLITDSLDELVRREFSMYYISASFGAHTSGLWNLTDANAYENAPVGDALHLACAQFWGRDAPPEAAGALIIPEDGRLTVN